jgi:branched-subunit amino acid transport protein
VTGWRLAALIGVVAAGVLLPKAVPAALVAGRVGDPAERFLKLLPAALLGGLTAVGVLGGGPGLHPRPAVLLAVVAAVAIAALTGRSLTAMLGGWAVLAAALLIA